LGLRGRGAGILLETELLAQRRHQLLEINALWYKDKAGARAKVKALNP